MEVSHNNYGTLDVPSKSFVDYSIDSIVAALVNGYVKNAEGISGASRGVISFVGTYSKDI